MRTEASAKYVGVSPATLVAYRQRGIGPAYSKVSRFCIYDQADLDAWVASLRIKPGTKASSELEAA
jgi:hypothetical protein